MDDNEQLVLGDKRYTVSLDIFEGPLDLLLHLIRKHELDIFDIPISFVTKKYLEYLDVMEKLNLNLASEYLEMAAQLTLIKSKMMLPDDSAGDDDDIDDDGPDPREELVRQLLEYQKYKTAANDLLERPLDGRDTFINETNLKEEQEDRDLSSPGLPALMKALQEVFDRLDLKDAPSTYEVEITRISITARIHQILDFLLEKKKMPFIDIFKDQLTKANVVVSFLAILEMTKLGLAKVHQAGPETEIHVSASADKAHAESVLDPTSMEY